MIILAKLLHARKNLEEVEKLLNVLNQKKYVTSKDTDAKRVKVLVYAFIRRTMTKKTYFSFSGG